ncbi:MAG: hypothetical protein KOO63_10755 [Bacteroidales bacterium]|nr:hypothetical protein [Candidatus Latescibacterota bacterium]
MYIDKYGKPPSAQGLKEGIDALEAQARHTVVPVGLRTMPFGKGFALDLCEEQWRRAIISPGEWKISQDHLPQFRRGAGAQSLPMPVEGGSIEKLRRYVNICCDEDWILLLGWLVYALQPNGPYPILVLQGEHGACKSTAARILVCLVDPNEASLIALPKSVHDLMVVAKSRHVLAYDNVSCISPDIKDALCRIATGSGHATRKLYSDNETVVWSASKPIILNGIDNLLIADDLADRAISITLPFISEDKRIRESELMQNFQRERFEILGALLDAAALALEASPPSPGVQFTRMADFDHFAASAAGSWGVSYEQFHGTYRNNRCEAVERGLDTDPLAHAICSFLETLSPWQGTKCELLSELRGHADTQEALDSLPTNARSLGAKLRRVSPALRIVGIEISELGRTSNGYQVRIEQLDSPADVRSERHEHSTLLNLEEEKRKREI